MSTYTPSKEIATKVLQVVDAGLVNGVGEPIPGQMCVEAAVCFAFGLPHGDNPPCVGAAVREFKIHLNDCRWSSPEARAKGMRKLAVAQLGSDSIDQMEFGKRCYVAGVQKLMPIVLRKVAEDQESEEKKARYLELASACEKVSTVDEARHAAKDAYASAYAYAYASASASAYASASASAYAYASAWFQKHLGDEFLTATAEMGLGVLIEMKAPGCEYLSLCE